ncbi:diptericin-A-like [Scaptodrosophila lebanonensis]|uniref:Diptericin-A-like n=1 Tax=Drosophila lebanonensis TaxID=7225 RepID=A0A6J2UH98_DROLE|nr:diptericin-A-like [Scaptodrosophila lebanonensis]
MHLSVTCLFLALSAACAYAYPGNVNLAVYERGAPLQPVDLASSQPLERVRRQQPKLNFSPPTNPPRRPDLFIQGGGSPRQGIDLNVQTRVPVWQSGNGRHSVDALGNYGQHLGGPYGNSRPQWGAGAQYSYQFG